MLKRLEKTNFPNGAVVRARDVDFNVLSFEDQARGVSRRARGFAK